MSTYRDDFKEVQRETWWSMPRVWLMILGAMVGLYVLGFIATGGDLIIYKFWAPKQEAARRQVYENTKSYHQGSVQRLNTLCTQVAAADDDHKVMLNDVIAQEFSEWNLTDVPDYLHACLTQARK